MLYKCITYDKIHRNLMYLKILSYAYGKNNDHKVLRIDGGNNLFKNTKEV